MKCNPIVKESEIAELKERAEESKRRLIEAGLLKEYVPAELDDHANDEKQKRLAEMRDGSNKSTARSYGLKKKNSSKKKGDK